MDEEVKSELPPPDLIKPGPIVKVKALKSILDCPREDYDPHQNHLQHNPLYNTGYRCIDVIAMEKASGRHVETCNFAGYIDAKKCGCNGPGK